MRKHSWLVNIENYAPLIGHDAVERIVRKAQRLRGMQVLHVNSTFYAGGGCRAAFLGDSSHPELGHSRRLAVDPRQPGFFCVTKKIHNALQGAEMNLTDLKKEPVVLQNAMRMDLDADLVIIHDPQTAAAHRL